MRRMSLHSRMRSGLRTSPYITINFKLLALVVAVLSVFAIASPVWAQDIEWTRQFGTTSLSQFDGKWSGTTSQMKGIEFRVEDNAVFFVSLAIFFPRCGVTTFRVARVVPPAPIDANSFSITRSRPLGSIQTYTLAGTFASDTSASGSLEATFKIGRCTSRVTGGWSATKTPTPGSSVVH